MSRRRTRQGSRRALHERPVLRLPGAARFTDEADGSDPIRLVRELRAFPHLLAPLRAYTASLTRADGRPRHEGDWALLYTAYVASGHTSVQRFCSVWGSSGIWRECGFGDWVPDYRTVWLRFDELEGAADAFREAGDGCVQTARRHNADIGLDVTVDATFFQAHARLRHCCPDRAACRALARTARHLAHANGDTVEERRHQDAALAPDEVRDNRLQKLPADDPRRAQLPAGYRYYLKGGHLYSCRDETAGARMYDRRFWLGGMLQGCVDVVTGGVLAVQAIAADEMEHHRYADLIQKAQAASGTSPARVSADRGYSLAEVFQHNSQMGIASVIPYRRAPGERTRKDVDRPEVDRHGVPRCRHCGGPGDVEGARLGFTITGRGEPVIRHRCQLQLTPECESVQQISCSIAPRLLLPLSRLTEQYHAMHSAGKQSERIWAHWRARYAVAGKNAETRTRRRGSIRCQELRAQAARLIDWFRILLRNGWLGSHRQTNDEELAPVFGRGQLSTLLQYRDRVGLNLPYGPAAVALGFAAVANSPPD